MRKNKLLATLLLTTVCLGGHVAAQSVPQLGMDANTQAIGDMSEAQVLEALRFQFVGVRST